MDYKVFDKRTRSRSEKVYARFKDNICAADLAEMGSLSSKNKNVKYLFCAIDATDFFTKYTWVKPKKR